MTRYAHAVLWAIALTSLAGIILVLVKGDGSQDASTAAQSFLAAFAGAIVTLFLLVCFERPRHG